MKFVFLLMGVLFVNHAFAGSISSGDITSGARDIDIARWSKNPTDWENRCSPEMHYCPDDKYKPEFTCGPRQTTWLRVEEYVESASDSTAAPGVCSAFWTNIFDGYWNSDLAIQFACDPAKFEKREEGNYVKVRIEPFSISKLPPKFPWNCELLFEAL